MAARFRKHEKQAGHGVAHGPRRRELKKGSQTAGKHLKSRVSLARKASSSSSSMPSARSAAQRERAHRSCEGSPSDGASDARAQCSAPTRPAPPRSIGAAQAGEAVRARARARRRQRRWCGGSSAAATGHAAQSGAGSRAAAAEVASATQPLFRLVICSLLGGTWKRRRHRRRCARRCASRARRWSGRA